MYYQSKYEVPQNKYLFKSDLLLKDYFLSAYRKIQCLPYTDIHRYVYTLVAFSNMYCNFYNEPI